MPEGNRMGSGWSFPLASRSFAIQQSSRLMYLSRRDDKAESKHACGQRDVHDLQIATHMHAPVGAQLKTNATLY
jgi:hypothetical protein